MSRRPPRLYTPQYSNRRVLGWQTKPVETVGYRDDVIEAVDLSRTAAEHAIRSAVPAEYVLERWDKVLPSSWRGIAPYVAATAFTLNRPRGPRAGHPIPLADMAVARLALLQKNEGEILPGLAQTARQYSVALPDFAALTGVIVVAGPTDVQPGFEAYFPRPVPGDPYSAFPGLENFRPAQGTPPSPER